MGGSPDPPFPRGARGNGGAPGDPHSIFSDPKAEARRAKDEARRASHEDLRAKHEARRAKDEARRTKEGGAAAAPGQGGISKIHIRSGRGGQ